MGEVQSGDMRALIVSLSTYSSSFNDEKLAELGRRIDDVTAVAADRPTLWGQGSRSRSGDGYRVVVLRTRFGRSNATTQLLGLKGVADAARPTVIHVECEPWQGVAVQSVLLARRLGVPVGVQFAENGPLLHGAGGALRLALGKWVLGRCWYVIGWSSESATIARSLAPGTRVETYPGTGVTMPSSVEPSLGWSEAFGCKTTKHAKLAFVGRFSPEKGLEDFLAIADRLAERIPVRVAIAGGPPSHPLVSGWLASRPWARVHGILARPKVAELLAAADVLVCPSRTTAFAKEQFGKTPVEAMSLGTPVFAFDCGALQEVIGDGGVVVREGAVDVLVDELEQHFQASVTARTELAKRARERAARFSDAALAEGLIQIWSDLPSGSIAHKAR